MRIRGLTLREAGLVGLYISVAIILALPGRVHAQARGTVSQNPVHPLGVPIRITNYPRPVRSVVTPSSNREKIAIATATPSPTPIPCPTPTPSWSFTLSGSYQFSSQRSRVGDVSLNSDSGVIDVTAIRNFEKTYTCFDIAYAYTHASGSSPAGTTETVNQHVGSLRVLQPFYFGGKCVDSLNTDVYTNQLALILGANYGGSLSSVHAPNLPSTSGTAYTFLGNALLDYQYGWFPHRSWNGNNDDDLKIEQNNYPNLLFEFSSGIEFNTLRLDTSNSVSSLTSSGRQLTYQNIGCLTFSLCNRLGILVAAEWDAPLDSVPLRGSRSYYANIAIFTAGLTYNLYQGKYRQVKIPFQRRWSLSLLYSYVAFDPLTETNQLQVQVSYRF